MVHFGGFFGDSNKQPDKPADVEKLNPGITTIRTILQQGVPARVLPRQLLLSLSAVAAMTFAASNVTSAQFQGFNTFHDWFDIATIYNFSGKFRYDGDYGVRGLITDRNWTLVYLRPSVRYKPNSWMTLHGGAALFYNFFQNERDLPELRPWVGIRFTPELRGWVFAHYFRLEGRAFYLKDRGEWDAGLRGRYQLQVVSPGFALGSVDNLYALTFIEVFSNLATAVAGTFGDRFRYDIGIGKKDLLGMRVELNYLWHKFRVTEREGELEADDHVVRLRIFYSFN